MNESVSKYPIASSCHLLYVGCQKSCPEFSNEVPDPAILIQTVSHCYDHYFLLFFFTRQSYFDSIFKSTQRVWTYVYLELF